MKRILIASRGEMARRLIRDYRDMGLETVSVFSEPDAEQPWVDEADYAVYLNGSSVAETYLHTERVISAALDAGCEAIHPGYCFLAERLDFFSSAMQANMRVIATEPQIMARAVDRFFLREVATEFGIPLIPSSEPLAPDDDGIEAAAPLGFPLYVKAVEGGVVHRVESFEDLPDAVAGARVNAQLISGSSSVYLERAVDNVRQLGTTVVADRFGSSFQLGHADKSLQLRYRSWLEELGPGVVSEELEEFMAVSSLALMEAIEFVGVARIRWVLTPHDGWYLLGISARLTTGYSLVEQVHNINLIRTQQRVLDGDDLGWEGGDLTPGQYGIQLRILHADPTGSSIRPHGVIERLEVPADVHCELGSEEGQLCTGHTEPLLASMVVTAPTRVEAVDCARDALERTVIKGVPTNRDVLLAALNDEDYRSISHNVHLINRHLQG